jgi:hypothetical protein
LKSGIFCGFLKAFIRTPLSSQKTGIPKLFLGHGLSAAQTGLSADQMDYLRAQTWR